MNTDASFALACAALVGVLGIVFLQPQAWPVLVAAAAGGALGYVASRLTRR